MVKSIPGIILWCLVYCLSGYFFVFFLINLWKLKLINLKKIECRLNDQGSYSIGLWHQNKTINWMSRYAANYQSSLTYKHNIFFTANYPFQFNFSLHFTWIRIGWDGSVRPTRYWPTSKKWQRSTKSTNISGDNPNDFSRRSQILKNGSSVV